MKDAFDSRLRTHKLRGMKAVWAFSVDYDYRIMFRFLPDGKAALLEIGTHDIYD